MTENVCQTKQGYTNASLTPEVIGTGGVPTEENGYTDFHGFVPYIYNIDQYNAEHGTHYQSPLGVLCQNQENCKRKSVDNNRTYNAFALTARMDNATLHPGCRCALPWAMCFCAYSACWSMYFLRTSSQSKSGTVPFWVQQTGHPIKLDTLIKLLQRPTSPSFENVDTGG